MSRLTNDWYKINEIIVYGFGNTAKTYIDNVCKMINVIFIIDRKSNKKELFYNDIPIYAYEEIKEKINGKKIVIMAETRVYREIAHILERNNYIENKDFACLERFICEWGYQHLKKIQLLEVHTAITTMCTFNCRKCNMFMPYYKNKIIYPFKKLKETIDMFFDYVDYVFKYQIIGGEPLLHKDLAQYIDYIYKTYGNKMGCIRIITNGSVIPDKNLIETLKACSCEVHISNYLHAIDYEKRYKEVIECLEKNGINYTEIKSLRWRDIGFPEKPCDFSEEDVKNHMITCGTSWHGLIDKKLYYCNSAWSAAKCGLFTESPGDYVELEKINKDTAVELLDLCLGDLKTGYNSFCKLCGGLGEDNHNFIQAGEQKL